MNEKENLDKAFASGFSLAITEAWRKSENSHIPRRIIDDAGYTLDDFKHIDDCDLDILKQIFAETEVAD